ncbi:MAG: flavin reductase family protein, partial [Muribaculaceae bacterium]|nr:flavin reductase family protein [Muribaculaceae bacterium]
IKEIIHLGSHDMMIADVLCVRADDRFIDPVSGAFSLKDAGLMAYVHGGYYELGDLLGKFGFSVKKN